MVCVAPLAWLMKIQTGLSLQTNGEGSLLTLARAPLEEGWGASLTRGTPRAGGRQGSGGRACLQLFLRSFAMKRSKDARWRLGEDVGSRERVCGGGVEKERGSLFSCR